MTVEREPVSDSQADDIVRHAADRGLGRNPRLRFAVGVSWSAFLGASLALVVLMLMPEGWLDAPVGFERLSLFFLALWTLAIVPALSAAMLCRRRGRDTDAG